MSRGNPPEPLDFFIWTVEVNQSINSLNPLSYLCLFLPLSQLPFNSRHVCLGFDKFVRLCSLCCRINLI